MVSNKRCLRFVLGVVLGAGVLVSAPADLLAAPSDAEIKANLNKYIALFEKKSRRADAFLAKRALKQMSTDPARGRRFYEGLKQRWDTKYGDLSTLSVDPLKSLAEIAKAKAAKQWKVLEVTCMYADATIALLDAACKAAREVHVALGNQKRLKAICAGNAPFTKWRHRSRVCKAVAASGAQGAMKAFGSATCATVISVFEKNKDKTVTVSRHKMSKEQQNKNFATFALKMAKCKKWDYLFTNMMHWGGGSGPGRRMLDALAKAGHNIEKQVFAYMKRHRGNLFTFKNANYALDHLVGYLWDNKLTGNCKTWVKWAYKLPDNVWGNMNWYLRKARCKGAVKVALKRLGSGIVSVREGACTTVGELGGRRHARRLRPLAKGDGYFKWVRRGYRRYRIWPVREACAAAIARCKVR